MPTPSIADYHVKRSKQTKKQRFCLDSKGKLHRGIEKKWVPEPIRRSSRWRDIHALDISRERPTFHLHRSATLLADRHSLQHRTTIPQANNRKRKWQQEPEDHIRLVVAKKTPPAAPGRPEDATSDVKRASPAVEEIDPIDYWTKEGNWPKKCFEVDEDTRAYLTRDLDEESWAKNFLIPNMEYMERMERIGPEGKEGLEHMRALLARPKPPTLRRNQSSSGSLAQVPTTPSDQKPRETKSAEYKQPNYETVLATKGSFMKKDKEGPKKESKDMCRKLLEASQDVPESSRFSDSVFESTCERVRNSNEAKVIDKIARLIVPSAEDLAEFGSNDLEHLVESINEGWSNSIPVAGPRPQPDYAVGFGRSVFTEEQLNKLQPFVGELMDTSFFMATWYMYFPFLTCEVKCGAAVLDIADRQNAHSMTLAVRATVELFKLVKREKEVDREILAFSVSHDHRAVRMYGHYPVINGKDTKYYRHPIHEFSFTALDGKEKWTAYKFTKSIYDKWMPSHLERILSAIDDIPLGVSFELSQSASFSQGTQIPASRQSFSSISMLEEDNSQPSLVGSQDVTPNTSFTEQPFKKPRNKRAAE